MNTTLEIVVVAIILLVMAVVILAFFSQGMNQGQQLTDARNQCITMAAASCQSFKVMPPTWKIATVNTKDGLQSCDQLTQQQYGDCSKFGVAAAGGGTGGGGAVTGILTTSQCIVNSGYTCEAAVCPAGKTPKGACDSPDKKVCCG